MKRIYYYETERTLPTWGGNQPSEWFDGDDEARTALREKYTNLLVIYRYANENPNDHTFKVIWEKETQNA